MLLDQRKKTDRKRNDIYHMYELVEHDPTYSTLYMYLFDFQIASRIKRVVQIVHFYLFLTLLDIVDIGSMD